MLSPYLRLSPYLPRAQLYCICENSGVVVEMNPDSGVIVVTSHEEPLGTSLDRNLEKQQTLKLGKGPWIWALTRTETRF